MYGWVFTEYGRVKNNTTGHVTQFTYICPKRFFTLIIVQFFVQFKSGDKNGSYLRMYFKYFKYTKHKLLKYFVSNDIKIY